MKPLTIVCALLIAPVFAQKLDFNFPGLAAKAKEAQEINIGPDLLEKMTGEMQLPINSVSDVRVRHYEFAKPGEFSQSDLDGLRKQATDGGWTRFLNIKEKDESTEIYNLKQGDQIVGFLVIAAEAKELSIVYVAGTLSLTQLQAVVQSSIQYDMKNLEQ